MKQDILEQIAENWLLLETSTFTKANVRYKPKASDIAHLNTKARRKYTVTSDIDVLAIHLGAESTKSVSVVTCKSWQHGFHLDGFYHALKNPEKDTKGLWRKFRELVEPFWAKAFRDKIFEETGTRSFTYYIAVTKIIHDSKMEEWIKDPVFLQHLSGNNGEVSIVFITLADMVEKIFQSEYSTEPQNNDLGRFIQLLRAANLELINK